MIRIPIAVVLERLRPKVVRYHMHDIVVKISRVGFLGR